MDVKVRDFDVEMWFGNNGITMEVRNPDGKEFRGKLRIGKGKLEWCRGRTRLGNGKTKYWNDFIKWMES